MKDNIMGTHLKCVITVLVGVFFSVSVMAAPASVEAEKASLEQLKQAVADAKASLTGISAEVKL